MGHRLPGLAHRVLGDGAKIPRRLLRHPLRWRRSHSGASHQRDRANRGARRYSPRQFLDARLFSAVERRQDGQVRRRIPPPEGADRSRLRSARVPLPLPDGALPHPDELHLGRARRGDDRARSPAQRCLRCGRDRRTGRGLPRALRCRTQRRPQYAAGDGGRMGSAARWIACAGKAGDAARVRPRVRTRSGNVATEDRDDTPDGAGTRRGARGGARGQTMGGGGSIAPGVARHGLGNGRQRRRVRVETALAGLIVKLATLKNGTRDGQLAVVSRDLRRAIVAGGRAPTMQAALDDWQHIAPMLAELSAALDAGGTGGTGTRHAIPFDASLAHAPFPRAYQWVDGSAYVNHVELVRKARGAAMPPEFWTDPLMYQGGSDTFLGPLEDIVFPDEAWGIDFEAEIAVVELRSSRGDAGRAGRRLARRPPAPAAADAPQRRAVRPAERRCRHDLRLSARSEEHTSEL